MHTAILRLPDVKQRTGLSRSSIYLRMKLKQFPRQISLGGSAVGWVESEIQEWIEQHIASSREG